MRRHRLHAGAERHADSGGTAFPEGVAPASLKRNRPPRLRRRLARPFRETGAAAVEFALIVPVLLLLLLGIVEFGRVFNAQISLSAAAREGARAAALGVDVDAVKQLTSDAAPSLNPPIDGDQVSVDPDTCVPGVNVEVIIEYPFDLVTGIVAPDIVLTGRGVMRCGG